MANIHWGSQGPIRRTIRERRAWLGIVPQGEKRREAILRWRRRQRQLRARQQWR